MKKLKIDIDFSIGQIKNVKFINILNDALDFSESKVSILNINAENIGDKAVSSGENSIIQIDNLECENSFIGVANKDGSSLILWVKKNLEEGKGFSLKGMVSGKGGTNYQFASSNPMWRATLEILDFLPPPKPTIPPSVTPLPSSRFFLTLSSALGETFLASAGSQIPQEFKRLISAIPVKKIKIFLRL